MKAAVDIGSTIRGGNLVAIDGATMADIVRLRDDAAGATTLAALRDAGRRVDPTRPGPRAARRDARRVA